MRTDITRSVPGTSSAGRLLETQLRCAQIDIADTQLLKSQLLAPASDIGFQRGQVLRRMIKWLWQYMFLVAAQYNRRHVYVAC